MFFFALGHLQCYREQDLPPVVNRPLPPRKCLPDAHHVSSPTWYTGIGGNSSTRQSAWAEATWRLPDVDWFVT